MSRIRKAGALEPNPLRNYLGLASSQHDSAIAIVDSDGEVVFAEANERSLKTKRAWNAPPDAMPQIGSLIGEFCDPKADLVASLSWSTRGIRWTPWIHQILRWKQSFQERFTSVETSVAHLYENQNIRQSMYKAPQVLNDMMLNLEYRVKELDGFESTQRQLVRRGWDHHLCHAATACYTTENHDNAIVVVVDGMGEGGSVSTFSIHDDEILRLDRKPFLNMASVGLFYGALCWACGFDPLLGEEWKVMGLAALGKKDSSLYKLMKPMLQVRETQLKHSRDYSLRLNRLLKYRHGWSSPEEAADLAHTGQLVFTELTCELLTAIHQRWGGERLLLGGGCALNSSSNGLILGQTPFKSLHVPMAPGDDGTALGAAMLAWKEDHPQRRIPRCRSPYLGSRFCSETIDRICERGGLQSEYFESDQLLVENVAQRLVDGSLVGWVQGRAEFGPRALGNRSILADPRDPMIKDNINQRVKFRENFRPFAPSVLHEFGADYFADYQCSPFMERSLKHSNPERVPGVVHGDGTGRLQSVTKELNPRFHSLLLAFMALTGIPMLLNTSLNVMGRPIAHDVEDAVALLLTTGLDVLVLHNYVFVKRAT